MFLYVDYLEVIGAGKLFVTNAAKVRDGGGRARARACYEEPKQVLGQKSSEGLFAKSNDAPRYPCRVPGRLGVRVALAEPWIRIGV